MITLLRKHSRWLMIVIAILSLPFCLYFVRTDWLSALRTDERAPRIYGQTISPIELERGARVFDLARDLGMINFLQDLVGSAQTEREAKEQFALNLLIVRHEADTLGVQSTSAETAESLKKLPAFRGKTGFDLQKYNDAVQNYLGPRGFSESQLEQLAADQVCLDRIKQLLGTGVAVSDTESATNFDQLYSQFEVSVVRLKPAEVANDVRISDEDIRKYYEANKEQLKSEEKRKAQFVAIGLSEEQKKLAGKERVDALQKLSDRANDVSQALAEKGADFAAVAAKFGLPVGTTGEFTQAAPDPQLSADPQLAQAAFQLSQAEPNSEPVQVADGFYILHLSGINPSKPLSLEEARPKIVDALKARREHELLSTRAAKISHDLREALKSGETLPAALQRLNLKPEKLPRFALADDMERKTPAEGDKTPDLPQVKQAVADLQTNDVTEPIATSDSTVIAIVEKRDPPDAGQAAAKRATLNARLLRGKREIIFYEWLRQRRRVAGLQMPVPT